MDHAYLSFMWNPGNIWEMDSYAYMGAKLAKSSQGTVVPQHTWFNLHVNSRANKHELSICYNWDIVYSWNIVGTTYWRC